jgi:uncharacterized protein (DUF433 family)
MTPVLRPVLHLPAKRCILCLLPWSKVTRRLLEVKYMFERITFDPQIMGGRACIRGMRITVSLVVNLVANDMSFEEILKEYPSLEAEDIRQALQYAAFLANEEIRPMTGSQL